jgi:hypothetical protein
MENFMIITLAFPWRGHEKPVEITVLKLRRGKLRLK